MKTTERFERAVTKLYTAFHNGALNAMSCSKCAVGNICDGNKDWSDVVGCGNSIDQVDHRHLKSVMDLYKNNFKSDFNKGLLTIKKTGYSPFEIAKIEALFLEEHDASKDGEYKGLCAVVEYLCELDGIPNVMDYSSLFEYDDLGAVNQLETVFP